MEATGNPRVKICCIADWEEAWLAIQHGASALGLVSAMPSGPGVIEEGRIAEIAAKVPPPVATFLLTSKPDAASIVAQHRRCGTNTVQICDRLTTGSYGDLKEQLPGIRIVQVIHVVGQESVDQAAAAAEEVDAILLDSGNPALAVKELGGTGRRHDWKLSRQIRERIHIPLFLAGGLKAENARRAIEEVGPFALDVCTGVRTDGKLDPRKLEALFSAVEARRP
jgi:phosphoribosylanthranilate isomerase